MSIRKKKEGIAQNGTAYIGRRIKASKVLVSILLAAFMLVGSFSFVFAYSGSPHAAAGNTVTSGTALSTGTLPAPSVVINGTLPYIPQGAIRLNTINLSQETSVFIGLKLQNNSELNSYLSEVSNPSSVLYRHYLSHQQFVRYFEVNSSVYNEIASYYSAMGLNVVTGNDRGYIQVSGSLLDLQKAFNTTFGEYSTSLGDFYFNLKNISVPLMFSKFVNTAIGFNNYPYFTPALTMNPATGLNFAQELSALENGTSNGVGLANAQPPYTPYATELAYNETGLLSQGINGEYITIAVTDAYGDPTSSSDLLTYDALFNMPATNSYQTVYPYGKPTAVSTVSGTVESQAGWVIESALDIEMAHATAPYANIVSVISPDDDYTLTQVLVYTITNDIANVISNSWGAPEPEIGNEAQYFHPFAKEAAAMGITVLAATGDQGSAGYDAAVPRSVMWPSDDPYVLAVGGTSLFMNGTVNTNESTPVSGPPAVPEVFNPTGWANETAWDGYTGGGYSIIYPRPSWQVGEGIPTSGRYADRRGVPDVAMDAMFSGNAFVVAGTSAASYAVGGTSFASPLWAGVIATADSYELDYGNGNLLGFVSPTLYAIFNSPVYNKAFHDILYGYNGPDGYFNAGPGWSPVTGLGSPNIGFLTHELTIMTYTSGAFGDYYSAHATGVSANITTVLPARGTLTGTATDYAFVNVTLSDGTQIMVGYTASVSNPYGSWFYAIIPASSTFYSESFVTGAPGSAGLNGSINTFSVMRVAPDTWSIEMNGKTLATFGNDANSTGSHLPYFAVSIAGDFSRGNMIGQVNFTDMQYVKNQAIHSIPSLMSYESGIPLTGISPPYQFQNPLGVSYSNGILTLGSGVPYSNGKVLFGVFVPVPPPTVLLSKADYVTLYAQHVDSRATAGESSFPMTTAFPTGQGNFNSFYLVPVEGLSTWSFQTSQSLATPLFLSTSMPVYAHFFVAIADPATGSTTGAIPVTVSIEVLANGMLIGANSTTKDLSPTYSVQEYNITFRSLIAEVPAGDYVTMIVSWYSAQADGTNIGYLISPQTGSSYPISLTLPTFNPVSISPPGNYTYAGNYYVYSNIESPFGSYDVKSISALLNGYLPITEYTNDNSNYTFDLNSLQLKHGDNTVEISASDMQGNINDASTNLYVQTLNYHVRFIESGLPSGITWYVNITGNGARYSLKNISGNNEISNISLYLVPATYSYSVSSGDKIYAPDIYTGTFTVSTKSVLVALSFAAVHYSLIFNETGLPHGVTWYANLTGTSASGPASKNITYSLDNGTYSFSISSTDPEFAPNVSSGSVRISGSNVTVYVGFSQEYFTAKFTETGLPENTVWYVNLSNGVAGKSTSSVITFTLPIGSYRYTISTADPEYVPSVSSGEFNLVNQNFYKSVTFYAKSSTSETTFMATGLPQGTAWSVHLSNGDILTTMGSQVTALLPFGVYHYWVSTPDSSYHASGGTLNLMTTTQAVEISFSPVTYVVTLAEAGMSNGLQWSISIGSSTFHSNGGIIVLHLQNGTYDASIESPDGYKTILPTITIAVHGAAANESVAFLPISSAAGSHGISVAPAGTVVAVGSSAGSGGTAYVVARKFGAKIVHGLKMLFGR